MKKRALLVVAVAGVAAAGAMGFLPWLHGSGSDPGNSASTLDADAEQERADMRKREHLARIVARPLGEQSAEVQARYKDAHAKHAGQALKTLSAAAADGGEKRSEQETQVLKDLAKELQP